VAGRALTKFRGNAVEFSRTLRGGAYNPPSARNLYLKMLLTFGWLLPRLSLVLP